MKSQSRLVRLMRRTVGLLSCKLATVENKTFHQLEWGARRSCTILFHVSRNQLGVRQTQRTYCTAQHPVDLSFSLDLAAASQSCQLQL